MATDSVEKKPQGTIAEIAEAVEKIEDAVVETKAVVETGKVNNTPVTILDLHARVKKIRELVDAITWSATEATELLSTLVTDMDE